MGPLLDPYPGFMKLGSLAFLPGELLNACPLSKRAAGRVQLLNSCCLISFRSGQSRWPGPVAVPSPQVLASVGISLHAQKPSTPKLQPIIFPAGVPDRCLSSVPTGHHTVRRARVQIPPGTLSWVTSCMKQNYMHPAFPPPKLHGESVTCMPLALHPLPVPVMLD